MDYLKAFVGFILVFLLIDGVWINLVIKSLYAEEVGHLLRQSPNLLVATVFYVVYAGCIIYLIKQSIEDDSLGSAFFTGAIIGLLAYGTFTMTNYAVLEGWTLTLVVTDIAWGIFITGLSALSGVFAVRVWPSNR